MLFGPKVDFSRLQFSESQKKEKNTHFLGLFGVMLPLFSDGGGGGGHHA